MKMRAFFILFSLWLIPQLRAEVDFSSYDTPVYQQIINRIKEKVHQRLGDGPVGRDRYFIIPFAYENRGNDPEYSHSFISVIRVYGERGSGNTHHRGLMVGKDRGRAFEAYTISWLPADFLENPNLIVFRGKGARLFPKANEAPLSPGKSFSLEDTIKLGANVKNAIVMWGPYEIDGQGFELGVKRKELLDGGTIKYRADDRLCRKEGVAINCFHAIAGLDELYPNGGLFGTGFKMWGVNGTARVLIEYTHKAKYKGLLLEPVDIKEDRFAFVYAPTRLARGIYNPVENAAAYRR